MGSTTTGPTHGALRRAQALAATSSTGLEIARWLLTSKVAGQRELLPELPDGPAAEKAIALAMRNIDAAGDLQGLVGAEAQAAGAYWEHGRTSRSRSATPASFPSTG